MAIIQIPNLPGVTGLSGAELFEGVQAGSSVKITLNQIIAAARSGLPTTLPIPVSLGGTGLSSFKVGDIMYASATQTFSKLADVATGNALISGGVGVAPSYGKIGLTTHVSGVLPVANGGTNQSAALTQYGVIYGNTTSSMASSAAGTSTQVLHGNASGAPTFGAVSLTADVSGVLPVANGGTNISSYTIGAIPYASTAGVLSQLLDVATGNALLSGGIGAAPSYGKIGLTTHVSGTLPVGNGGTGQASNLTQYGVVYGSTTTAMATTAAGTTTTVLHGNAAGAPTFGAVSLTADITGTLAVGNGGTGATTSTGTGSVVLQSGPTITNGLSVTGPGNCIVTSTGLGGYGSFDARGSGTNSSYVFFSNVTNGEQFRLSSLDGGILVFSNGSPTTNRFTMGPLGQFGVAGTSYGTSGQALVSGGPSATPSWSSVGTFTTLSASSTVSGTGFSTYLASPPAIGGTTAASVTGAPLVSTTVVTDGFTTLAAGTLALAFASKGVVQVTPNATGTFTTTVPPAGTRCTLIVLTSGTTTYTMTFGTGFKTTGTLITGVVTAQRFVFQFISDGTSVIEASRTVAIA